MTLSVIGLLLYVLHPVLSPNEPFSVYGRVVDAEGFPLSNVEVNAEILSDNTIVPAPWGAKISSIAARAVTNQEGRFVIVGRGVSMRVGLEKAGYVMPDVLGPEYDFSFRNNKPKTGSEAAPLIYKMSSKKRSK